MVELRHGPAGIAEAASGSSVSRATTVNLILAHFVVTSDAKEEDLRMLFDKTPANIVVVTYDLAPGEKPTKIEVAMKKAIADQWYAHWVGCGVVLGKKVRIASVDLLASTTCGPHLLTCFRFVTRESCFNRRFAVAVAAMYHNKDMGIGVAYDNRWLDSARSALAYHQVRFLAGVFSCPKEQVEALVGSLHNVGSLPFFQPWRTEDAGALGSDEDRAAVAARFGVWPSSVMNFAIYPAYAVMLGPCKDVVVPNAWDAP